MTASAHCFHPAHICLPSVDDDPGGLRNEASRQGYMHVRLICAACWARQAVQTHAARCRCSAGGFGARTRCPGWWPGSARGSSRRSPGPARWRPPAARSAASSEQAGSAGNPHGGRGRGGGAPNILGDTSQVLTQSSEAEGVACAQARIVPLQNGNWTAERRAAPSAEYRRMSGRVMGEAKRELTSGLSHLKVDRVC